MADLLLVKTLLVTNRPPLPTNVGGNQRTNLLYRALRTLGEVDLLLESDPAWIAPAVQVEMRERFGLRQMLPPARPGAGWPWRAFTWVGGRSVDRLAHNVGSKRVAYAPVPHLAGAFAAMVADGGYDVVVGRYLKPTANFGALARLPSGPPCVLDVDDLDTEVYRSRLSAPGTGVASRLILRWHLSRLEGVVPALLTLPNALWVSNPADRARPSLARAEVLPNIPFPGESSTVAAPGDLPGLAPSPRVLFVGTLGHPPNSLGLNRFLTASWPGIVARVPGAVLEVVGTGLTEEMRASWGRIPGVILTGAVASLDDCYERATLTICPLITGAGTNIKVLESLSRGRTVVATAFGVRGLSPPLEDGRHLHVVKDVAEMAEPIAALLVDPVRAHAMAVSGRSLVERHYSFGRFSEIVAATIERVMSRGSA